MVQKIQLCNFQNITGRAELDRNPGNIWDSVAGGGEKELEITLIISQSSVRTKRDTKVKEEMILLL